MKYRKLRIVWSVAWGVVAVLVCVLWVRSYWWWDQLYNPVTNKTLVIAESASGRVIVVVTSTVPGSPWMWHISQKLRGQYWAGPLRDFQTSNRDKGFGGFAHYATPWNRTYRVPYWFLAGCFAMLAAAPWLRWSNRFSLRTLLIAMTLIAVVLRMIAWMSRAG